MTTSLANSTDYVSTPPVEPSHKLATLNSDDELIHHALCKLNSEGVQMIIWGALLDKHLRVPRAAIDCSLLIPDEQFEFASGILSDMNLPLMPPDEILSYTEGEFHTKGYRHRVSKATLLGSLICIHLFPASFATFTQPELFPAEYKYYDLLVPRPSAVYASVLRMMARYPRPSSERARLEADLEMLIHYNLLDLQDGFVKDEDWAKLEIDRRIEDAVCTVRSWGLLDEWREGEEWMEDALISVIQGNSIMDFLPWRADV